MPAKAAVAVVGPEDAVAAPEPQISQRIQKPGA